MCTSYFPSKLTEFTSRAVLVILPSELQHLCRKLLFQVSSGTRGCPKNHEFILDSSHTSGNLVELIFTLEKGWGLYLYQTIAISV